MRTTAPRVPRTKLPDPISWTQAPGPVGGTLGRAQRPPTGGSSADLRRDLREIPARQTTIPAISQCTLSQTPDAPPSARLRRREPAVSRPRPGHNAGVLPMIDGSGAPWFRFMVEGVI